MLRKRNHRPDLMPEPKVPAASKSDLSPSDHFGFLTRFESIPDLFSVPDWIQFVRIWLAVSNILECWISLCSADSVANAWKRDDEEEADNDNVWQQGICALDWWVVVLWWDMGGWGFGGCVVGVMTCPREMTRCERWEASNTSLCLIPISFCQWWRWLWPKLWIGSNDLIFVFAPAWTAGGLVAGASILHQMSSLLRKGSPACCKYFTVFHSLLQCFTLVQYVYILLLISSSLQLFWISAIPKNCKRHYRPRQWPL